MESCFDSGWCFLLMGGVLLLLRTEPRSFFCCGVDLERGSWMRLSRRFVCWRRVDERWRVRSDGGMSRISTAELSTESKTHLYFVKTLAFLFKKCDKANTCTMYMYVNTYHCLPDSDALRKCSLQTLEVLMTSCRYPSCILTPAV